MKRVIFFLAAVVLLTGCRADISPRCVQDFNFDWYFALGDSPEFAEAAEPMEAPAWSRADFDDSAWRPLHLPHDWAVEGEFSATNPSGPGSGALPGGIGWYRKRFVTPKGDLHSIEFDGVFMNSTVYLNGHTLGTRPYGYSSFSYDLTPYLRPVGKRTSSPSAVTTRTSPTPAGTPAAASTATCAWSARPPRASPTTASS